MLRAQKVFSKRVVDPIKKSIPIIRIQPRLKQETSCHCLLSVADRLQSIIEGSRQKLRLGTWRQELEQRPLKNAAYS